MKIRLATPADDASLRSLARRTAVPGHIRIIYAREPMFFEGVAAPGGTTQVIVAERNGRIVGQGCRTVRRLYVNGKDTSVGYLSGLRLDPAARNGTLLARGYAFLKTLHGDHRTSAYLTTIVNGNHRAETLLTSRRTELPHYAPLGRYLTHVLPVRSRPARSSASPGIRIATARETGRDNLLSFLRSEGPRRQFFPVCEAQENGFPTSVGMDNILVAVQGGTVAGTIGVWDQSATRQCIVEGYSPAFRLLMPLLNMSLRLRGCHRLPVEGERLRLATAALVCVRDDDEAVFRALVQAALDRAAARGLHQLALGTHAHDPLAAQMTRFHHVTYRSLLYLVSWDTDKLHQHLDPRRVPYLELGTL